MKCDPSNRGPEVLSCRPRGDSGGPRKRDTPTPKHALPPAPRSRAEVQPSRNHRHAETQRPPREVHGDKGSPDTQHSCSSTHDSFRNHQAGPKSGQGHVLPDAVVDKE